MKEEAAEQSPVNLFYSYAAEDEALRNELEKHLALLRRQGFINPWHQRLIVPGTDWNQAIDEQLNKSEIILLLISADFIASDYCYGIEMQRALERNENGEAMVIPVILRPTDLQNAPFARLACLPGNNKPVTLWEDRDEAFLNIAYGIRAAIEYITARKDTYDSGWTGMLPPLGTTLHTCHGHTDWVSSVAWSSNGKYIASGGNDKTVRVWDAATGKEISCYDGHSDPVLTVAWSPDSSRIASGSKDKTVQIWKAETGEKLLLYRGHAHALSSTDWVLSVAWSPYGTHIASGSTDETARVWDAITGEDIFTFRDHVHDMLDWRRNSLVGWVLSVAWSPDGKRIASASGGYGRAFWRLFDAPGLDMAYDKRVLVWDALTGSNVSTYESREDRKKEGHTKSVTAVTWSPDGRRIASASRDNTVQIWNPTTARNILTYRGHTDRVNTVAWSPRKERIASAGDDKTVQIWNPDTGERIYTYRGHTNRVNMIVWSPDGTRIASASDDRTVQVWVAL